MNKILQSLAKPNSLADFTSKLSAKWHLSTTQTRPEQPASTNAKSELQEILAQLISFPTVTGSWEANHDALAYVETFLRRRGMHIKRLEWNGIETLIATTRKNNTTPKVLLNAHIDVVPGEPDMFTLQEKDGKLYGRGTLDMKFSIAAYMQLIDDLKDNLADYDLAIMINSDEEVGGLDGAARIAEEEIIKPQVLIAPDGAKDFALETYAKGICWLTLTTSGKSAHASRPWEGSSATHKLLEVIAEIQKLFPANPSPDDNTMNVGVIHGGSAPNQIAASASTTLDIRLSTIKEDQRIRKAITRICQKAGVRLTTDVYSPPFANDPNNPFIKSFAESVETVTGTYAGFTKSNALNDARFFGPKGIPCIIFYPPGGDHHGQQEFIYKDALYQTLDILRDYVEKHCHNPAAKKVA